MKPTIHFVIIATNVYSILGIRLIKNINKYYTGFLPHKIHIYTDIDPLIYLNTFTDNVLVYGQHHNSWQNATNSKFNNIIELKDIEKNDYVYYLDADTGLNKYITEFDFIGDIVAAQHFSDHTFSIPKDYPFDRNPYSKAYIPINTKLPMTYYQGAFFGGRAEYIMPICKILKEWQKEPYEPAVNDESYLNKFFHISPPSRTLLCKKFPFIISNKGGIKNSRAKRNISEENKERLLSLRNYEIDIVEGNVVQSRPFLL